ncbi:MAG TPA: amidohydrolase family protein [Chthoniobacterales bacterium]|nr:amidohydrolase family protein [Chthoniobacterales bacterium]
MIVRAKVIVTMDGPPIENGAVAISGERIVDVGMFSEVAKTRASEDVVDLGEQAVLPGLINAHCHLDYTGLRGKIPRQKSFTDWIRAINAEKAKLAAEDYVGSINDGFAEAKRFGTTTIANLTAFPKLVSQIQAPIRTWWFAELIDVRDPNRASEIVDLAVGHLRSQGNWGLAPHALFTASANLYRRSAEVAPLLTTHLAESREEMSMFRNAKGGLYDFLKDIGRDIGDCGQGTPVATFFQRAGPSQTGTGNRPYLLVHLNELAENDFDLLKKTGLALSIVHCPRSHAYSEHSPFEFQKLRDLGFNICLGTDSLASNDDLSLFAELRAFQQEFPNVSPEKAVEMVTLSPARALQQEKSLGKIAGGFAADLIAVPLARSTSIFEEIVGFKGPVRWSMVGGRILA